MKFTIYKSKREHEYHPSVETRYIKLWEEHKVTYSIAIVKENGMGCYEQQKETINTYNNLNECQGNYAK